jgi:hypothetical protein
MLEGTFETSTALSAIFLWVLFGYLSRLLNCDLQRLMTANPLVLHLMGLTTFFFLFTMIDTSNKTHIAMVWVKTVLVYVAFILMTKSKWYFIVPILFILLADQTFKKHLGIQNELGKDTEKLAKIQEITSKVLGILVLVLIGVGTLQYMVLQRIEYKDKFSFYTFFFGVTKCKELAPKYGDFRK